MTKPLAPSTPSIAAIVTGTGTINAVVDGKPYSIAPDSQFYAAAKQALKDKNANVFIAQCDLDKAVRNQSRGRVALIDGVIVANGVPVHNALTKRIYELIQQDFEFDSLLNFLERLLKNPSKEAIEELYLFLEANTLPITEDGHFLAYRRVNDEYLSIHANPDGSRNSNKVGETVSMKRDEVDANRDRTCSRGLHFCSVSYLPHYPGSRTVIVKIDPADVVSIPSDYNNQKGRCCKYEVVDEVSDGGASSPEDTISKTAVYEVSTLGIKPSGQKFHNLRDGAGKFVKRG